MRAAPLKRELSSVQPNLHAAHHFRVAALPAAGARGSSACPSEREPSIRKRGPGAKSKIQIDLIQGDCG